MAEFLTRDYIELYKNEIKKEFEQLVNACGVVVRRPSPRWRFFHHCFDVLVGIADGDFDCSSKQAREYKFHIKQRLGEHYNGTDTNHQFTFHLEEVGNKARLFGDGADYPSSSGYLLLIAWGLSQPPITTDIENILKKVVSRAVNAKYEIYHSLRFPDLLSLEASFVKDGPAYNYIKDKIARHRRDGEVISNVDNQSYKQVREIKVHRLWGNRAQVTTKEFWLLHWWSSTRNEYTAKRYEGEILQSYTLVKRNNRWLIWSNNYKPSSNHAL